MAQAARKSVDVQELKEVLQRQGIALSADKAAGLAAAIETRLAAGWSGQLKAYHISWTSKELNIVSANKILGSPSFHGDFAINALLPPEGSQLTVEAETPPDGTYEFVVLGGTGIAFICNGELAALWPKIAESGTGAGKGVWGLYKT